MSDPMCQTRSEIIENDPQIQKAVKELDKLQNKDGNGHTRREILEYEMLIESRIEGVQTKQDVGEIKSLIKGLVKRIEDQSKYPTIIYQLMRMPLMGWSLFMATGLGMWLISQLEPDTLIKWLNAANISVTSGDVKIVVAVVTAGLLGTAVKQYVDYVEECEESQSE